jgi:hypothetical protein
VNIDTVYALLTRPFRRRRMREFVRRFELRAETPVLDVGGAGPGWALAPVRPRRIVMVNVLPPEPWHLGPGIHWVMADARRLRSERFLGMKKSLIAERGAVGANE